MGYDEYKLHMTKRNILCRKEKQLKKLKKRRKKKSKKYCDRICGLWFKAPESLKSVNKK